MDDYEDIDAPVVFLPGVDLTLWLRLGLAVAAGSAVLALLLVNV
jgi:hypothetical protein